MFQSGEVLIILLLALIVLGPTRLPELARRLGKWIVELRAAAREITQGLEAEVGEFKKMGDELRAPVEEVKDELREPLKELEQEVREADPRRFEWKGPKPVSGPTPEDAMRDLEEIEKRLASGDETVSDQDTEVHPDEPVDEA
ncbi:MAG: twin-arginine translocase TatA/TatE family subunit [Acidimicrobiia bacterium]